MIKVSGRVNCISDYIVELDISEEDFNKLKRSQQDKMIEDAIDFNLLDIYEVEIDDDADIEVIESV